jgi:hypothetical protein
LWGKLGRLTHYAFDAVLSKLVAVVVAVVVAANNPSVSTILAGMKRSTGLTYVYTLPNCISGEEMKKDCVMDAYNRA